MNKTKSAFILLSIIRLPLKVIRSITSIRKKLVSGGLLINFTYFSVQAATQLNDETNDVVVGISMQDLLIPIILTLLFITIIVSILLWHSKHKIQQYRKIAEANEYEHKSIVETIGKIGEGLFVVDKDYRVRYMNQVMIDWFGDNTGKICYKSVAGLEDPCPYCQLDKVIEDGKTVCYQPTTPDNQTFEIVAVPYKNRDGSASKMEVIREITERKRAEDDLIEKDFIIQSSSSGIATANLDGEITYVNPAFLKIWGYDNIDQVLGKHFIDFWNVKDLLEEINASLLGEAKLWENEVEAIKQDGSIFYVQVSAATVLNANNEPIGLMSTSVDISERIKVEAAFKENLQKQHLLTENISDMLWTTDLEFNTTYVSPSVEQILGFTQDQYLKRSITENYPKKYIEQFYQLYNQEMRKITSSDSHEQEITQIEAKHYCADGKQIWVAINASIICDKNSKPSHIQGISRNITAQKIAEKKLKKYVKKLEKARTASLNMMIDLEDARQLAEQANKIKSSFLANMSHEIRTPMNGVIGMTRLLLDTELTEEQRKFAEIVQTSGESLLTLINDILDFSKMEAEKLELETLDFNLLSLLDHFVETFAIHAQNKGLELLCSMDQNVPTLLSGDPGRLRQILTNLLSNAIKFTEKGEIEILVKLEEQTQDDVLLCFTVRDTGIGVPDNKIDLMFDKFTQADSSTTRKFGGTGLGLSISKQLVNIMGGDIGLTSQTDIGSEFWFTTRLIKQSGIKDIEPRVFAELKNLRVLIVVNNASNREILSRYHNGWGMRPDVAISGSEALTILSKAQNEDDPFDIIIIDMQLADMDGASLGRSIKANPLIKECHMLILIPLVYKGNTKEFAEIGFLDYLTKPVRVDELRKALLLAVSNDSISEDNNNLLQQNIPKKSFPTFEKNDAQILLVEDNITNQMVAKGMLNKIGVQVDIVSNGLESVKVLETIPYDLILMDCQMPVMDGYEATIRIRKMEIKKPNGSSEIPIIAMTANAMQGDREKCLEAGMNDYLTKPVTPNTLVDVLEKWLH